MPLSSKARDAERKAAQAFENFTGHSVKHVDELKVADNRHFWKLGDLVAVAYDCTRDGRREKYLHEFNRKSRPILAVSHDGKQLVVIGGKFEVTDAGIVDKG